MDKLDIFKSIKSNMTILQNSKSIPELCFIRDITKSISKNSTIKNGRLGAFSKFNKKDNTFGWDNSKHVSGEDEKQNYKGQDLFGTIYDSTLNSYNKDIPEDFKKETEELVYEEKPIKKETLEDSIESVTENKNILTETKPVIIQKVGIHFCNCCLFKTGSPKLYKSHLEAIHLMCDICEKIFADKSELNKHQEGYINSDGIYPCQEDDCLFKSIVRLALQKHIQIVHKSNITVCEECFAKVGNMKAHKRLAHGSLPVYQCPSCALQFKALVFLNKHKESHENGRLDCDQCTHKANTMFNLRNHKKHIHNVLMFFCLSCSYKSPSISSLRKHERKHKTPTVKCKKCATLVFREDVHKHKRKCNKKPTLFCSQCTFKSKYLGHLRNHEEVHITGKFQCDQCDFGTEIKTNMTSHIKIQHEGGEVFECGLCEYKTAFFGRLSRHKEIHSTDIYSCVVCEYKGKGKSNLRVHMKRHQEPKFICTECSYKTYDSANFGTHKKVKHGNVILKCDICEYDTKSKRSLRKHAEKHINNVCT